MNVVLHLHRSPQQRLDALAGEGLDTLAKLFNSGLYLDQAGKVAKALAATGSEGAETLFGGFDSNDYRIREAAVIGVGDTGDRYIDKYLELLDKGGPLAQSCSAKLLGMIGGDKAIEALIASLWKENKKEAIGEEEPGLSIVRALSNLRDKRAVPVLTAALATKHPWRRAAAMALGEIGSKEAIPFLIAATKDEDGDVKTQAPYALEKIVGKRTISLPRNGVSKRSHPLESFSTSPFSAANPSTACSTPNI